MQSTRTHSWYARFLGFLCGASLLWPWVSHFASTSAPGISTSDTPPTASVLSSRQLLQTPTKQDTSLPLQLWGFGRQGLLPPSASPPHRQLPSMSTFYGWAILDRSDETMTVHAQGLPATHAFDVWLIERPPPARDAVLPALGTATVFLGSIHSSTGASTLYAKLHPDLLDRLSVDALLVLSPQGTEPIQGGFFLEPRSDALSLDTDGQCPLAS